MKRILLLGALSAALCSCSLLQRHDMAEGEIRDSEPYGDGPLFTPNGQEIGSVNAASGQAAYGSALESEVARLNTKVAALETKLDVLSTNMEKMHLRKSQPVIEAEVAPEMNLAAPVAGLSETPPQISAAPARPLPKAMKAPEPGEAASAAEKDFRSAMQLFQNGQNLDASSRFALMAKTYPDHLLAGHALYWAGESAMRAQQADLALQNWSELEKRYPRSAYIPEALSGLAKAYETQGDAARAKQYRSLLLSSFPKSPVALRFQPEPAAPAPMAEPPSPEEEAPAFEGGED